MGQEEDIKRVNELISLWVVKIKTNNCLNFFDINRVAEDLAVKLLNEIYNLRLENLNDEKPNYPGLDLGDKIKKIAFQVTSRSDAQKIKEGLESFFKKDKETYTGGIRFLVLSEKKPRLTGPKWQNIDAGFNPKEHIITYLDLIKEINKIYNRDRDRFDRIQAILEEEVAVKGLKDCKVKAKGKQIKILALTAAPEDGQDLRYEMEQDILLESFKNFDRGEVFLDMPDPVNSTLQEMAERLVEDRHDILLISAHGGMNDKGEGILSLEDDWGEEDKVTGQKLAGVLGRTSPLVSAKFQAETTSANATKRSVLPLQTATPLPPLEERGCSSITPPRPLCEMGE